MLRNVTGDLYQIGECVGGSAGHEAIRVYVLLNAGHPIIVDCGSQLHRDAILQDLEVLLAGRAPEYVFLTHSELPHAGNLLQVAHRWPKIKVIVSNVMLPYIEIAPGLPSAQVTTATPGSTLTIAGRRIEFVEALLKDQPGSQWIHDAQTGALFTGDGFGYTHAAGECEVFADETGGVEIEQFRRHHTTAFRFLRWVIAERFNADLDRLFARYPATVLAPIHGNAIRSEIPAHVDRLKRAVEQICAERVPSLMATDTVVFGEGLERVAVRPITPDIYWITHCLGDLAKDYYAAYFELLPAAAAGPGDRIVDYPFSAFLIKDDRPLLIDTNAPRQQANMLRAIEHILGDQPLDYIFISHIELPHAGNAPAIQRRYPGAKFLALHAGEHYALHGLADATLVAAGDVLDLGRHRLEIVDALFVDHGLSMWAYEHTSGLLFTADWAHNLHEPARGQCFAFLDEMEAGGYTPALHLDDAKINAWYQFPWLKWTDPDEIAQAVENLFQRYDVKILAPSHGSVIRQNAAQYAPLLAEAMRQAVALR